MSTESTPRYNESVTLFGAINQAMFDWPWSVVHLLSGGLIGSVLALTFPRWSRRRFWSVGVALLIAWELLEVTLRYLDAHAHEAMAPFKAAVAGFAFAVESPLNILGDLIAGSVGLALGRTIRALRPKGGDNRG